MPLLGTELAVLGIGGLGAYFFLSRRRTPAKLERCLRMKEDELLLPPGMSQEYKLPEADRVALKEAFLNNADYKWLSTPPQPAAGPGSSTDLSASTKSTTSSKSNQSQSQKKLMMDITWYMVECLLRFVERYGYLLVQRDPFDNTFQGVIGLIPPYKKWWRFKMQYQFAALSVGRTSVPERLGCGKRYKAWMTNLQEQHQQTMQQNLYGHWYIPLLGVVNSKKRKGIARKMTETATRLCVRPIYIQCNDEATNFFQKVGFVLDKRFPLTSTEKEGEGGGGGANFLEERDVIYYNSMTCQ